MEKKQYTRADKIEFWTYEMLKAKRRMAFCEARLQHVQSDQYQDWTSELAKQLDEKKKA